MPAADSADDLTSCRPERLRQHAKQLVQDRGWGWPNTPRSVTPQQAHTEADQFGYTPDIVHAAEILGLDGSTEMLVSEFLKELDHAAAEVLRQCVAVVTGRSGRPHGTTTHYPGEGAVVFIDGALLLMYGDVLGHAMSLVTVTPIECGPQGQRRLSLIADPPKESTTRAVASAIQSFRQPFRGFNLADLPQIGTDAYSGEPAYGKLLWFGERFLLGHEFAHALLQLGVLPETPRIRELIRTSVNAPPKVEDAWVQELTADGFALELVVAATSPVELLPTAVLSSRLAVIFLGVLERSIALAPYVPFPLDISDISGHLASFPTHPPAELRSLFLDATAQHQYGAALAPFEPMAQMYEAAIVALFHGLFEASGGRCIAPLGNDDWCSNDRGPSGWFCQEHGRRR